MRQPTRRIISFTKKQTRKSSSGARINLRSTVTVTVENIILGSRDIARYGRSVVLNQNLNGGANREQLGRVRGGGRSLVLSNVGLRIPKVQVASKIIDKTLPRLGKRMILRCVTDCRSGSSHTNQSLQMNE